MQKSEDIQWMNVSDIRFNQENPRKISKEKLDMLVDSLRKFPEMLHIRPIVVDENNITLGGNMRLKAIQNLGYDKVPVLKVENLTEEQKKEFIIKDNLSYGEWDWNILDLQWDKELLLEWGLDIDIQETEEEKYTRKIEAPTYEPTNQKPKHEALFDLKKMEELIDNINNSNIDEKDKEFLRLAAHRHIVFDYSKIADFYAHASKEVQGLMEDSALVIIDYNKAIEAGYVRLSKTLADLYSQDHDDQ